MPKNKQKSKVGWDNWWIKRKFVSAKDVCQFFNDNYVDGKPTLKTHLTLHELLENYEQTKSEWEKRFDEWAEETTAIYISDDEDEHSITFDELPKYENLKQFIAQEKQRSYEQGVKHAGYFRHRNKLCDCFKKLKQK